MTVLETERLRLRELTLDDAAFVQRLVGEPGWRRFIGDSGVETLEDARAYVERACLESYARHGFGLWGVELLETGELVGLCGLIRRESLADVDLGFAFLEAFQGRGYATESGRAVLEQGERALGLGRVVAITSPDNAASVHVLRKLGFRREGPCPSPRGDEVLELFAREAEPA